MKLTELAIDGVATNQQTHNYNAARRVQLGTFSDGLTLVYGESGSGKSTARRFIGDLILGLNSQRRNAPSFSSTGQVGQLSITSYGERLQLWRENDTSPIRVQNLANLGQATQPLTNTYTNTESIQTKLERVDADLYETVFSVSFRDTPTNLYSLARILQSKFAVPSGPGAAGDDSALLQWQRETSIKNDRIETLRAQISPLEAEKSELVRQIESARLSRQSQIADLDRQINALLARINELQYGSTNEQVAALDREINQLQLYIDNAKPQINYVASETRVTNESPLYRQLDYLENQINRWRRIQSEVQEQRIRLRDEMLIWNEMTLDSDQHPYYNARQVLINLESHINEAERNAKLWAEADITRVDASQLAESMDETCRRLRDGVYGLCNELSQQYKHIRHKAAAVELKQLRHYYNQMGDNIEQLTSMRNSVVTELRSVDPAGAEAVIRADAKFLDCAMREGYLAARVKFVGQLTRPAAQPTYQPLDLTAERTRLGALQHQRNEMVISFSRIETELSALNVQHSQLVAQRDRVIASVNSSELELKIQSLSSQILTLNNELSVLVRELEALRNFVPPKPNSLVQRACEILNQISEGDLTQVFLGDSVASSDGLGRINIQVRDRHGKVLNASAVEAGLQDQVYLSLILACHERHANENMSLPIVLDDAFSRIQPNRVSKTLRVLNDHGSRGHQVIAFTQHRYLADRLPGVPVLELNPGIPNTQPLTSPERSTTTTPVYVPPIPVEPYIPPRNLNEPVSHTYVQPVVTTNTSNTFVATDTTLRSHLPQGSTRNVPLDRPVVPVSQTTANITRPYPLSKYPRNDERRVETRRTATFPFTQAYTEPNSTERTYTARQETSSVSVDKFGDRMGFVVPINEATSLRKIALFDAGQLRLLDSHNLETAGDLLALEDSQAAAIGFSNDQFERWIGQLCLLMTVPGMRIDDSRILVACGVFEPEQLDTSHPQQLYERIQRFLGTTEGRRFTSNFKPISLDRISGWYRALDATRSNWENRRRRSPRRRTVSRSTPSRNERSERAPREPRVYDREPRIYDRDREQRESRNRSREIERQPREPRAAREPRIREQRIREPRVREPLENRSRKERAVSPERKIVPRMAPANFVEKVSPTRKKTKESIEKPKLKFYLDLNDHIEAAPSIGPKAAERFEKIGIHTVADFLKQTPDSISQKVNYKRMTAEVIRSWQHQARLVCRVPNLRGHDAQLLVACGITEPEEFSTMQPKSLFEVIGPFSETKQGLKIIRNGKKPDLAEITDWISWAEHNRSLQAA